ncbi:MAG: hypothetical protein OEY34_00315, partial [Cyclobacteriaceae bacterium]|nr:hypothetical protein [Cyclobacteriaceae bacterium]
MKIFFTLILTGMSLYLVRGQGASLSVQTGHSVEILDIQFSPDGKLLSSRDANNVIKIWFVPTGNEMASFRYHHTIKQLKFNHSGNQLVILDEQNKLSFLDIGSMSVVREESINFSAKNMDVVGESIIFSGDKIHVLAEQEQFDGILNGYEAFTIHYSDTDKKFVSVNLSGFFTEHAFTNTNYKIHIPKNPDQHPMGFSVDNKYFAIGSFAKVIIYNLKDKSKYFTFNSNYADEYFTSVAFSTVNNIVVAANSDGLVYVADLNQKRIIRRLKDHITGVNSVVFNKDETIFATASKDRSIILWDAKTLSPLKKLSTRSFQINTVTVAKSQPLIAFGDEYGYVKLIDFDDISFQVYHARYHKNGIADISFIDGDKKLIVGGKDNRISVLKVNQSLELEKQVVFSKGTNISKIGNKSLNLMGYYTESLSQVEQINCSSDGSVVLVNGKYSNGENVKSLVEMFTIPKLDKIVKISTNQMDKSSIDKKIVFENITNGWKISAGVNEGKYMDFDDKSINMKNIKFLEEGIMFTDTNGKLYIKPDDKELNLSAFYKKWESFSKNLDYDKNYNCLAVSIENSIYIIDEFGNTTNLDGHQDNITSLQFFDNGKLLISSSKDATLKIWDTKTKKLKVTIIPIDFDKVVMISPDNYYLAPKGALDGVGFKQGIDFFPVQQFDLVYNRPDI